MADHQVIINSQVYKLIPLGFCACGCGGKTTIAKRGEKRKKMTPGRPMRYLSGHNQRGENNYRWKNGAGYKHIKHPTMPIVVREHRLLAEKALGKPLPIDAVIHHVNGSKRGGSLVICQNTGYHRYLHQRERALKICGHATWLRCPYCKKYDDPTNMYVRNGHGRHKSCHTKYETLRCHKRKNQITG